VQIKQAETVMDDLNKKPPEKETVGEMCSGFSSFTPKHGWLGS